MKVRWVSLGYSAPQVPLPAMATLCERNPQTSPEGRWRTVDLTNRSGGPLRQFILDFTNELALLQSSSYLAKQYNGPRWRSTRTSWAVKVLQTLKLCPYHLHHINDRRLSFQVSWLSRYSDSVSFVRRLLIRQAGHQGRKSMNWER